MQLAIVSAVLFVLLGIAVAPLFPALRAAQVHACTGAGAGCEWP